MIVSQFVQENIYALLCIPCGFLVPPMCICSFIGTQNMKNTITYILQIMVENIVLNFIEKAVIFDAILKCMTMVSRKTLEYLLNASKLIFLALNVFFFYRLLHTEGK